MKILLISETERNEGGSSRAAYRLSNALIRKGANVEYLVLNQETDSTFVVRENVSNARTFLNRIIDSLPLRLYKRRNSYCFSLGILGTLKARSLIKRKPDIIHFHRIFGAMISISQIGMLPIKTVWTLHDYWPLTGGCHIPLQCNRFTSFCGKCPQLDSRHNFDITRLLSIAKKKVYSKIHTAFIAPSNYMFIEAQRSPLISGLPLEKIPNCIDTTIFRPYEKSFARKVLDLPQKAIIVGYGALNATNDQIKGYTFFREVLKELYNRNAEIEILTFGSLSFKETEFPYQSHILGPIFDEKTLVFAYSALDIFLCPSVFESLSYTVMEAQSCGVPVVAFNVGGISTILKHLKTGYLARPYETKDLVNGIEYVLQPGIKEELSINSRKNIEHFFSYDIIADKHICFYEKLLSKETQ